MHNPEELRDGLIYLRLNLIAEHNQPHVPYPDMPHYEDDEWDRIVTYSNENLRYPTQRLNDALPWSKVTKPEAAAIAVLLRLRDIHGDTFRYTWDDIESSPPRAIINGKHIQPVRKRISSALRKLSELGCIVKPGGRNVNGSRYPSSITFPSQWWESEGIPDERLAPSSVHVLYVPEYTNPSRSCAPAKDISLPVPLAVTKVTDVLSFEEIMRELGLTYLLHYDKRAYRTGMTRTLKRILPPEWIEQRHTGHVTSKLLPSAYREGMYLKTLHEKEWTARVSTDELAGWSEFLRSALDESIAKTAANKDRRKLTLTELRKFR